MPPKPHIYTHYTISSCTILQVYGHYGNVPFKRLALLGLYIIIGLMLLQWSREWHQMRFNVEKCKVCLMHFGHSNLENCYKMNGTKLQVVKEEKDLGVMIADNLKPSVHGLPSALHSAMLKQTGGSVFSRGQLSHEMLQFC